MKRIYISLFIVVVALAVLALVGCGQKPNSYYLRLHIRANGDACEEQAVKLKVRDAVVAYLTPLAGEVKDKEGMQSLLSARLDEVCRVADDVLASEGYAYRSRAYFSTETFPTRTYGDLTLKEGVYDALIVELGTGQGANWWCVAFPPLCFVEGQPTDGDGVQYRSTIADWFARHTDDK